MFSFEKAGITFFAGSYGNGLTEIVSSSGEWMWLHYAEAKCFKERVLGSGARVPNMSPYYFVTDGGMLYLMKEELEYYV